MLAQANKQHNEGCPRSLSANTVFVARQPILDATLSLYAYELLYRQGHTAGVDVTDGNLASAEVLVSTFLDIGVDQLTASRPAFINLTRDLLLSGAVTALPSNRVVLEILEDVEVDEQLLQAVADLSNEGYCIALDDFVYESHLEELIALADIIKIDVRALGRAAVESHVERFRPMDVQLLAEKVETQEEFFWLRDIGFHLFQGYFFAKPKVLSGKRLSQASLRGLRLLAAIQTTANDAAQIEELIAQDVSLSFKLLRLINSAAFGLPKPVSSIRRAVVYMGLQALKRWVSLVVMASMPDKPTELLRSALVRAKMCEILAQQVTELDADSAFTVGLFSCLDALLDRSMREILPDLPLTSAVSDALLSQAGPYGRILRDVLAVEDDSYWRIAVDPIDREQRDANLSAYWQAVSWADEISLDFVLTLKALTSDGHFPEEQYRLLGA